MSKKRKRVFGVSYAYYPYEHIVEGGYYTEGIKYDKYDKCSLRIYRNVCNEKQNIIERIICFLTHYKAIKNHVKMHKRYWSKT